MFSDVLHCVLDGDHLLRLVFGDVHLHGTAERRSGGGRGDGRIFLKLKVTVSNVKIPLPDQTTGSMPAQIGGRKKKFCSENNKKHCAVGSLTFLDVANADAGYTYSS